MYLMSLSHSLDSGNTDIRTTLIAASIAVLGATVRLIERLTKPKKAKRQVSPLVATALILAVTTAAMLVALALTI